MSADGSKTAMWCRRCTRPLRHPGGQSKRKDRVLIQHLKGELVLTHEGCGGRVAHSEREARKEA